MDRNAIKKAMNRIPPLSPVVQKLIAILQTPNASAGDIEKIINSDPVLASRVLKLVNSSFYGLPHRITTISRAIVILGHSSIRNLAVSLGMSDLIKKVKVSIDWSRFWGHSIITAILTHAVAKHWNYPEPEEGFVAGLLHDIGCLPMVILCEGNYPDPETVIDSLYRVDHNEKKRYTILHARLGADLLAGWRLPDLLVTIINKHHKNPSALSPPPPLLLTALQHADAIATRNGYPFCTQLDPNTPWHEELPPAKSACEQLVTSAIAHGHELADFLDIEFPAPLTNNTTPQLFIMGTSEKLIQTISALCTAEHIELNILSPKDLPEPSTLANQRILIALRGLHIPGKWLNELQKYRTRIFFLAPNEAIRQHLPPQWQTIPILPEHLTSSQLQPLISGEDT
ncbi:MAG: HDOD domain-containing protein [Lentisphaerae bacterium]|nr:MAG: HDOD domain-containing protein [Lentisphaerota bacterium]